MLYFSVILIHVPCIIYDFYYNQQLQINTIKMCILYNLYSMF